MKKLILVRHAKSSWKHNVIDHQRPLKKRGFNDADIVSNHLKMVDKVPDVVLSSDAVRAKSTAHIFIKNLNIDEKIVFFKHDLYDFSGEDLIQVIELCDNKNNELMIFGHNHAITFFVNKYGDKFIENVPTCGVVIIEFDIDDWNNLKKGKTIKTIFPRDLKK